jgi:sugar phosphate isomerase/epimerase
MFWAERDDLLEMKALGVRCGQLGIPGAMELDESAAAVWREALGREGFTLVTVFASYIGESYADIPTVARTVGFVPIETRQEREQRTKRLSDFAAALGVGSIACHIGCVPEDPGHPDYVAVREMVRRVCDHAARRGQTFALETGQESPGVLSRFLNDLDRPNVRINFDPANMIFYGTGEPIAALRELAPNVVSVHCKDAWGPPANVPGALGTERPLGEGSVGIERFVQTLREIGFRGPLNIEREAENQQERLSDMRKAVQLLTRLAAA